MTREQHCETHAGRLYFQVWLPDWQHWTGQCDKCAEQERLEGQAKAILATRSAEKCSRIEARCKPDEKQIERETEEIIEREAQRLVDAMEERRPEFEAEIRRQHWERCEQDVETEMLGEIVEQLRERRVS